MKVFNRGALAIAFIVADGRTIIIEGRNSSVIINSHERITEIADTDWAFIKEKYSYLYEIAEGVIFADSKISNVKAQARELENEPLADNALTDQDIKKSKKVK